MQQVGFAFRVKSDLNQQGGQIAWHLPNLLFLKGYFILFGYFCDCLVDCDQPPFIG